MEFAAFERVARHAWPALFEMDTEVGVLRCARGVSRRANSLLPDLSDRLDFNAVAATAESFYHGCGLPAVVRLVEQPGQPASSLSCLDRELAQKQFQFQAETRVLARSLVRGSFTEPGGALEVLPVSLNDWLTAWHELGGQPRAHFQTHQAMLGRISGRPLFALGMLDRGTANSSAVSCGLGVVCSGVLAIYGIATKKRYRRQGFAARVVAEIISWGVAQGASAAFLHVEAANHSALRLYQRLGFENFYSYWYRVKPIDQGGGSQ